MGGEGGGVEAVLGDGDPVGVDGLDVDGVGFAAPPDHEAFGDGAAAVDLLLGDGGAAMQVVAPSGEVVGSLRLSDFARSPAELQPAGPPA